MTTLRIQGYDELLEKLDPELLGPPITRAFEDSGKLVETSMSNRAPRFSGRLARSPATRIKQAKPVPLMSITRPRAPHAILVDKGTKPHFPPTDTESKGGKRFRRFVRRAALYLVYEPPPTRVQGMKKTARRRDRRERAIDVTAFLIARSISKRGTKAKVFVRPSFRDNESAIINRFGQALAELEHIWRTQSQTPV